MNSKSLICNFIATNPHWRDIFKNEFNITVKEEDGLVMFNYRNIMANFRNPIVREARGIIIYLDTLDVACWSMNKFANYDEGCADKIDWESAVGYDKIDGNIVKLWFNKLTNNWQWSTNGMIKAENAPYELHKPGSIYDLIQESRCLPDTSALDRDYTYTFELTSDKSRVILSYGEQNELWILGARNNITAEEKPIYWVESRMRSLNGQRFKCPTPYKFNSIEECIKFVSKKTNYEGLVVYDKYSNRIKVKTKQYVHLAHIRNNITTKEDLCNIAVLGDIEEVITYFPHLKNALLFYKDQIDLLIKDIQSGFDLWSRLRTECRLAYSDEAEAKKAFAEKIRGTKYSIPAFLVYNREYADWVELFDAINYKHKYVEDYKDE